MGPNKKTTESLFVFNSLCCNPWIYMDTKASLLKMKDIKVGVFIPFFFACVAVLFLLHTVITFILAIYGPVRNGFDAGRSNTRTSGRGLDPGN